MTSTQRVLAVLSAIAAAVAIWLNVGVLTGSILVAATWPDGDYRATFAMQLTVPPEAGFLLSADDFTLKRPSLLLVWNDQIAAEVTPSGWKTWRATR